MSLRARVLELALAELELGVAEVPAGSNTGPDVRRYLAGCVRGGRRLGLSAGAWCAAFASWCVWSARGERASLLDAQEWPGGLPDLPPIGYRAAVSELVADARATGRWHLRGDGEPQPGDLLVLARAGQDPRVGGSGHVVFVEHQADEGTGWWCVGGNEQNAVRRTLRGDGGLHDRAEPVIGWIDLG